MRFQPTTHQHLLNLKDVSVNERYNLYNNLQ
jgi:hypothetical protein